jgi:hypothetical protein
MAGLNSMAMHRAAKLIPASTLETQTFNKRQGHKVGKALQNKILMALLICNEKSAASSVAR